MAEQHYYGPHSARVDMRLIIGGTSIGITHLGPDFVLIEPGHDRPPGVATILLKVDETERRWQAFLPQGISRASKRVALSLCP